MVALNHDGNSNVKDLTYQQAPAGTNVRAGEKEEPDWGIKQSAGNLIQRNIEWSTAAVNTAYSTVVQTPIAVPMRALETAVGDNVAGKIVHGTRVALEGLGEAGRWILNKAWLPRYFMGSERRNSYYNVMNAVHKPDFSQSPGYGSGFTGLKDSWAHLAGKTAKVGTQNVTAPVELARTVISSSKDEYFADSDVPSTQQAMLQFGQAKILHDSDKGLHSAASNATRLVAAPMVAVEQGIQTPGRSISNGMRSLLSEDAKAADEEHERTIIKLPAKKEEDKADSAAAPAQAAA